MSFKKTKNTGRLTRSLPVFTQGFGTSKDLLYDFLDTRFAVLHNVTNTASKTI